MRMVLLGPPAAGKGTQGRRLAARFGGAHVDTGELLRAHVDRGTELGRTARVHMERGELLPDEVVIAMVTERLAEPGCAGNFVLDGFPRTVPQAEALDRHLVSCGTPLQAVVELRISSEELHRRVAERARTEDRGDDEDAEAVRRRIESYLHETRPLVDYYLRRELLVQVDGIGSVDQVGERIAEGLAARARGHRG
ncbi:MAG TPA: adenylate kinase [Actinomycetes bacterium]